MSVSSLLDTVLAREQRSEELTAERDDDFQTWVKRLNTESRVFLKRTKELDFTESEDRRAFFDLVSKVHPRFDELRERDEIGEVPVAVVMELDDLIDEFEAVSPPISASVATIGPVSPVKRREKKRSEKRHEREQQEYTNEVADELTEQLHAVYDALPDDK